MSLRESVSILLVCLDDSHIADSYEEETRHAMRVLQAGVTIAHSGQQALQIMRVAEFDLVAMVPQLPDIPVWELVQSIRSLWPWQKWALVGADVTTRDEIHARTLGVTGVFDCLPGRPILNQLARSTRWARTGTERIKQTIN